MNVTLVIYEKSSKKPSILVNIPEFDSRNCTLPSPGDQWLSPKKDEIDFRIERGYMTVTGGELTPELTFDVISRRFLEMDCRKVILGLRVSEEEYDL